LTSACWFKSQHIGSGQCPVKRYNRYLRNLIHVGTAKPSWLVSHELPLTEAPKGYQHFDGRDDGWTKVVLVPGKSNGRTAAAEAERAPTINEVTATLRTDALVVRRADIALRAGVSRSRRSSPPPPPRTRLAPHGRVGGWASVSYNKPYVRHAVCRS
jgi:hypothetical protein